MHVERDPMIADRRARQAESARDRGAVLPLVLLLIVITSLIVLPLMTYSVTVLRANAVQSDHTRSAEAAKGGIRLALDDPRQLFDDCAGSADLTPPSGSDTRVVDEIDVTINCTMIDETGALAALGYQTPAGVVAMRVGESVPMELSGVLLDAPGGSPANWWNAPAISPTTAPQDGHIWLPDLPPRPETIRSAYDSSNPRGPFALPSSFDVGGQTCQVFLPGSYSEPLTLNNGTFYFASGVYYFDSVVRVRGNARVIVGQGNADFGTGCSDDLQVATNLINPPSELDIAGGGATWVFGGDGRLRVDNFGGPMSLEFNQRYSIVDPNDVSTALPDDLVSIMTVNGGSAASASGLPTSVVRLPDGSTVGLGGPGANYAVSNQDRFDEIVEIDVDGSPDAIVDIAGGVIVPMSEVDVENDEGHDVALKGSVVADSFDIDDAREIAGQASSIPIGFVNDIVLQRRIRVTAVAGSITSTAIIQFGAGGENYTFNAWATQ